MLENIPSDMCAQGRLRSDCTFAQSDLSLYWAHEETMHPLLSNMSPVKILIRLRKCAGIWIFTGHKDGMFSDVAANII